MHQAQATQRSAFHHVLAHHTLESLMSDEELGQALVLVDENERGLVTIESDAPVAVVPQERLTVGLMYPPTKRWEQKESCLDYLRILANLPEHHYMMEQRSQVFVEMREQLFANFEVGCDWDTFQATMCLKSGALRLLTYITGEEHPPKPIKWAEVYWALEA
jgi:hypothetical protein